MAAVLVIAFSGIQGSGAAGSPNQPLSPQAREQTAAPRAAPGSSLPPGGEMNQQSVSVPHQGTRAPTGKVQGRSGCSSARKAVKFYAAAVERWRNKMGAGKPRSVDLVGSASGRGKPSACPRYLAKVLRAKAHAARAEYLRWRAHYRRLYEKWRCIHEHEGAWDSNTGNGYWGGLQMDWGFMHTYGPEFIRRYGLAHRWPVWAQLEAAERAYWGFAGYPGRGYSPWGTRGVCGL